MAGIISKGLTFSVAQYTQGTLGTYQQIANFQDCPSLGGTVDKVEVTCYADEAHKYIKGLIDYGDLDFVFLYDNSTSTSNYRVLKALEDEDKISIKITYPDTTTFTFDAQISVSTDAAALNDAITFTCSASLQSDITIVNPV